MSTHTGPGYWKITNTKYMLSIEGDKIRRILHPRADQGVMHSKPWIAYYMTDNPYAARKPMRFKLWRMAMNYALSGGTPAKNISSD
jgi:hypothetical protein